MLHLDLVFLIVTPMLLEFCILHSGKRNVTTSAFIAALSSGVVFAFLAFGPMWTVALVDSESSSTSGQHLVGLAIVALLSIAGFSIVAFIPAAIFGAIFKRFRGLKR